MTPDTLLIDVEREASLRNGEVIALVCSPIKRMARVRFLQDVVAEGVQGSAPRSSWKAMVPKGTEYVADAIQHCPDASYLCPAAAYLRIHYKIIHGQLFGEYKGEIVLIVPEDAFEIVNLPIPAYFLRGPK